MRKKKGAQEISNEVLCAEYEAVYHYALSICRNETEAQDLTQETFLKAMNAVESFKGNSSLSATDISILVLAIIFSLFGIKDVDKKLKNEE